MAVSGGNLKAAHQAYEDNVPLDEFEARMQGSGSQAGGDDLDGYTTRGRDVASVPEDAVAAARAAPDNRENEVLAGTQVRTRQELPDGSERIYHADDPEDPQPQPPAEDDEPDDQGNSQGGGN